MKKTNLSLITMLDCCEEVEAGGIFCVLCGVLVIGAIIHTFKRVEWFPLSGFFFLFEFCVHLFVVQVLSIKYITFQGWLVQNLLLGGLDIYLYS